MVLPRFLPALLPLLAALACYRPSLDPCAVQCADQCPAGLTCGADGFCHEAGDDRVCGIDAGAVDAPDGDGGADAAVPQARFTRISAGAQHVCAIDDQMRLFCWGSNQFDAFARSDLSRSGTPVAIEPQRTGWTRVSAGAGHTCGIIDGTLLCWGNNGALQTSQPSDLIAPRPVQVPGTGWVEVSAAADYTCGIQSSGGVRTLSCWGFNRFGVLGAGTVDGGRATPMPVAAALGGGTFTDWDSVSAGGDHTCAIRAGEVYCWGTDQLGELGRGGTDNSAVPRPVKTAITGVTFTQVSAGAGFTCAVGDSKLYCWGTNLYGETAGHSGRAPALVDDTGTWTAVAAAREGACGVRDGQVLCWGRDHRGQIGDGTYDRQRPGLLPAQLTGATAITLGVYYACALDGQQRTYCWGINTQGQVGNGQVATKWSPVRVGALGGWTEVRVGDQHSCALRAGDSGPEVHCWGRADAGQVGSPGDADRLTPFLLPLTVTPRALAVGDDHTCALADGTTTGEVWCWGNTGLGAVGNGRLGGRIAPTHAGSIATGFTTGFASITGSDDKTCALRTTGERWCWGYNGLTGELGFVSGDEVIDLPTERPEAPALWDRVALGRRGGCGITADDRLACWGTDDNGQRGDGASTPAVTPTVIDGATTYNRVAGGVIALHVCAITGAGALRCWGTNYDGELGVEVDTGSNAPLTVPGITGWTDIAVGGRHTCGIAARVLRCWGSNDDGAIGVDGERGGFEPLTVLGSKMWSQVSTGVAHTCAITDDTDRALYCWGENTHGQIGDGTSAQPTPGPVVVPTTP